MYVCEHLLLTTMLPSGLTYCVNLGEKKKVRYLSQETLRNPTKSAEILRGIRKASVQLSAELQYYFRGECLPFPRNDTSLSAE